MRLFWEVNQIWLMQLYRRIPPSRRHPSWRPLPCPFSLFAPPKTINSPNLLSSKPRHVWIGYAVEESNESRDQDNKLALCTTGYQLSEIEFANARSGVNHSERLPCAVYSQLKPASLVSFRLCIDAFLWKVE